MSNETPSTPRCTESSMHFGGGGKVALLEYSKITSDYSTHISRRYEIPEDWDEERLQVFEDDMIAQLKERVDRILVQEFNERWEQSQWADQ